MVASISILVLLFSSMIYVAATHCSFTIYSFFNMYAIKISSKPKVISKTFPIIKIPGALRRCIRNYDRTLWPALINAECFSERVIS